MRNYYSWIWGLIAITLTLVGCARAMPSSTKIQVSNPATEQNLIDVTKTATPYNNFEELDDAPQKPTEKPEIRLAILSDLNDSYGSVTYSDEVVLAIDTIIKTKPDIVICLGDMVAGQKPKLKYKAMWEAFHQTVTERLNEAQIPMAQIPGNHDASAYPKFENERSIYIEEWTVRKPKLTFFDDSAYPLYYSFVFKGFFFIALDVTTLDTIDEEQFAWLERQLAQNPTKLQPILFSHVPLYGITTIKPREHIKDARLAPLLQKYNVQLYMTGHQHAYFPAQVGSTLYLHSGAQGGGPRHVKQNTGINPKTLSFVNLYKNHPPFPETYILTDRLTPLPYNKLPTWIHIQNEILPRHDIQPESAKYAHEHLIHPHMTRTQTQALIKAMQSNQIQAQKNPTWTSNKKNKSSNSTIPKVLETPILRELDRQLNP